MSTQEEALLAASRRSETIKKANGISIPGQALASPAAGKRLAYANAKRVQVRLLQHRRVCMCMGLGIRHLGWMCKLREEQLCIILSVVPFIHLCECDWGFLFGYM